MAPINPNNTDRLKIFYQNAIAEHTLLVRFEDAAGLTNANLIFTNLVDTISAFFGFHEVTAVQQAGAGLDVYSDVPGSPLIGVTWGSGPVTEDTNAIGATFVGRSAAGRRVRATFFGYLEVVSGYRLTSGENSNVSDAIDILDGASGSFLAIDGNAPIWKRYLDIKPFDHWVDVARNG